MLLGSEFYVFLDFGYPSFYVIGLLDLSCQFGFRENVGNFGIKKKKFPFLIIFVVWMKLIDACVYNGALLRF